MSWGYRPIHTLLRREGWEGNHKRVQRLYREEGLSLRRERPKRRRMAMQREEAPKTTRLNERWGWTSCTTVSRPEARYACSQP